MTTDSNLKSKSFFANLIFTSFLEIKDSLKYVYYKATGKNLPIYKVNTTKLREYETSKKHMRAGTDMIPGPEFLDKSEKVYEERGSIISAKSAETAAASDDKDNFGNGSFDSADASFMREASTTLYARKKDTNVNL